jgi:transposase-like protein
MARGDIIFVGPTGKLNVQQIARITGISPSTLYRWRNYPDSIPAGELRLLFKAVKLPPEKVIEFFK